MFYPALAADRRESQRETDYHFSFDKVSQKRVGMTNISEHQFGSKT